MDNPTTNRGFALFETALGACGIAWHDDRVSAVSLPAADPGRTRSRLRRVAGAPEGEPPAAIERACAQIAALLTGHDSDLTEIEIDHGRTPGFDRRVYEVARTIGPGETMTYGEVAAQLGDARLAREVGAALGRNPTPLVVPCHRVIAADGGLRGFSAPGGRATKRRLLELERPHAQQAPTLFA